MDFYESIFQYDLKVQNKITERLNSFLKSINLLKKVSSMNKSNIEDFKYRNITSVIEEINSSNIFKNKLLNNQKNNLIQRLKKNNKNKKNTKFYIYAKDLSQDSQNLDIIEIQSTLSKKELPNESNVPKDKTKLDLENCFHQKSINYKKNKK